MPMNRFCRYELRTSDVDDGERFYRELFGADFWGNGIDVVPLPAQAAARGAVPHWLGHISTQDVVRTALRFAAVGATHLGPPPSAGASRAIMRDPLGAVVATTSECEPSGSQRVSWHLLNARDESHAFSVYAGLFGWVSAGTADLGPGLGRHMMFAWPGTTEAVGSTADLARLPHIHAQWLFFFRTEDLAASLAKVQVLGGLTLPSSRTPTGDLVAPCDDPQGAAFGLYQVRR
jgi:predicted enzyme related to lactoylglutathione lyase